jgi:hypothetical protein
MKGKKKPKASKATVLLRVTEVYRIRLAGAKLLDVQEYVREQEQTDGSAWKLADGDKPLSEAQICVYIKRADDAIAASTKESRKRSLVKNLARREDLYAKAVNAGDIRTALAVADSEAKLRGLFDVPACAAKLEPIKTPEDALRLIASTIADLRAGRLDDKTATTLASLAGTWLRSMEVTELAKRLEALQAVLLDRKDKDKR